MLDLGYTLVMFTSTPLFDQNQTSSYSGGIDPMEALGDLGLGEHVIALGETKDLLISQATFVHAGLQRSSNLRVLVIAPDATALQAALLSEGVALGELEAQHDWQVYSPSVFQDDTGTPDWIGLETYLFETARDCISPGCSLFVILDVAALLPHCARPSLLVDLEFRITAWVMALPAVFLCCYERRLFTSQELLGILDHHQIVMLGARWHLNPQYVSPDLQLGTRMLERRLQGLTVSAAELRMRTGTSLASEATAHSLNAMVCICSSDHRIDYANAQLCDHLGFDPVGHSCYDVLRDWGYPCPGSIPRQTYDLEAVHWEVFHPHDQLWYYVISTPLPQSDGRFTRQLLVQDITNRRMSEVDYERLVATLHRRNLQLQTAARVSRSVARILDPQQLMHRTVELIRESFDFYYVGVFLVDSRGEHAVLQSGTGEAGERMLAAGYRLPLNGASMVSWAIARGIPRIAWDVGQDEVHFSNPYLPETRSEMALPLISRGRCIGAITIQGVAVDAFTEEDFPVLQTIADHLSGAIENARLFEAAQNEISARAEMETALLRRNRELALLNRAGRALISNLDLDQFLATVLAEVQHLLEVQSSSVWLLDTESGQLICRQASGPRSDTVRGWRLNEGQGLVWWAVSRGRSLVVADVLQDPRFFPAVSDQAGINVHSVISVPLWVKQKVIGALQVVDEVPGRFDAAEVNLLESIAATITIVIENATLYDQARRDAETKSFLLREVNHRVKNNLMAIIGLLYAERRHAEISQQPMYQQIIDEMIVRLQGLTTVHGMLSDAEWMPLRLADLAEQIIHSTLRTLPFGERITMTLSPSEIQVTPTQAHNLALIINELVTNALRHGLCDRPAANLHVNITSEDGMVHLKFGDDGPGFPEDVLHWRRYNVGMGLVRNLMQRTLNGQVFLSNDNGAVVTLVFRDEVS